MGSTKYDQVFVSKDRSFRQTSQVSVAASSEPLVERKRIVNNNRRGWARIFGPKKRDLGPKGGL